jgi:hypothetical protein
VCVVFICASVFFPNINWVKAQDLTVKKNQNHQIAFTKWFEEKTIDAKSRIYNGDAYPLVVPSKFGHQFFESRQWQDGIVCMGDQWYYDLPLLFDIERELIIIQNPNPHLGGTHGILLSKELISYFEINQVPFIPLPYNKNRHFFEVLFKGKKIALLAKHLKVQRLEPEGSVIESSVEYFMIRDSKLILLKNKSSLIQIDGNAKVISREIKSHKAKFSLNKKRRELLIEFVRKFDEKIS